MMPYPAVVVNRWTDGWGPVICTELTGQLREFSQGLGEVPSAAATHEVIQKSLSGASSEIDAMRTILHHWVRSRRSVQ